MTLIISMCTKKGIYMISDSKVTDELYKGVKNVTKTIIFDKQRLALSFWGLFDNQKNFNLSTELGNFKNGVAKTDNVETVSEKLRLYFEKLKILDSEDELGFHLAGFLDGKPILKHIFHTEWLKENQFLNELSNSEYHLPLSNDTTTLIVGYKKIQRPLDFPILFNGDNSVPNLILNGLRAYGDFINYPNFNENEAKDFLIFLMNIAVDIQKFREHFKQMGGDLIGYPLTFIKITETEVKQESLNETTNKVKAN